MISPLLFVSGANLLYHDTNNHFLSEGVRMSQGTSCLMAPFVALWRLTATILELTGRFVAILIGFILVIIGILVSLTVVGAIIGIPLTLFGLMLMARGLS